MTVATTLDRDVEKRSIHGWKMCSEARAGLVRPWSTDRGRWEGKGNREFSGLSDNNIDFSELVNLLLRLGFIERTKGSHHNFSMSGIIEKINLQKEGKLAKGYQVRQVRNVIIKYKLGGLHDE
jgi:hypothetical protein